jgi:hypothetical protein
MWEITGNRNDITLITDVTGKLCFTGAGKQDCRPIDCYPWMSEDELSIYSRVREADCWWNISTEINPDEYIVQGMEELADRVKSNPERSHIHVRFYDDSSISFRMVVPESTFSNIRWMIEQILKSETLQYRIILYFVGFAGEGVKIGIPTWEEFANGKPYFECKRFSFVVLENANSE